ncbi:MAG: hypothetical protein MRZ32_09310 [Bacteroidales bacterium]|nr:hypothetical protein [Bacteroidales bacterium]
MAVEVSAVIGGGGGCGRRCREEGGFGIIFADCRVMTDEASDYSKN